MDTLADPYVNDSIPIMLSQGGKKYIKTSLK